MILGRRAGGLVPVVAERVARMGAWGPIAFIGVYVVGDLVLIPGSVLSLAGGALFGFIRGTLLVFLASTLGAVAAFLVARYIARRYVQRRIGAGRLAIDRAIARKGFRLRQSDDRGPDTGSRRIRHRGYPTLPPAVAASPVPAAAPETPATSPSPAES